MLSRTARLAALVTIAAAGLMLTSPSRAVAASRLGCGDGGLHTCCVDGGGACPNGAYCCAFDGGTMLFCGCLNAT